MMILLHAMGKDYLAFLFGLICSTLVLLMFIAKRFLSHHVATLQIMCCQSFSLLANSAISSAYNRIHITMSSSVFTSKFKFLT